MILFDRPLCPDLWPLHEQIYRAMPGRPDIEGQKVSWCQRVFRWLVRLFTWQ